MKTSFKIDEVALVFIVALLALAIGIYDKATKQEVIEPEMIMQMLLKDQGIYAVNSGVIDENKLKEIQKIDYVQLKNSLNAKNDFCIYIEDENGNVYFSKGSSKLAEDGLPCRE